MADLTPEERGELIAENHHHLWHRFGNAPWQDCEECCGLAEMFATVICAAEASALRMAAEWCDGREECADKRTGVYDQYNPGLSDAYSACADHLRLEADRIEAGNG